MLDIGGRGVLMASGPIGRTVLVGEKGGGEVMVPPSPLPSAPLTSSSDEAWGDFFTVGRPLIGPFPFPS